MTAGEYVGVMSVSSGGEQGHNKVRRGYSQLSSGYDLRACKGQSELKVTNNLAAPIRPPG